MQLNKMITGGTTNEFSNYRFCVNDSFDVCTD